MHSSHANAFGVLGCMHSGYLLLKPCQSVIWWLTIARRRNFYQHLYYDHAIMEAWLLFHDINMYITDWNCEWDWGFLFYMDNHGASARTWHTRLLSSSLMKGEWLPPPPPRWWRSLVMITTPHVYSTRHNIINGIRRKHQSMLMKGISSSFRLTVTDIMEM